MRTITRQEVKEVLELHKKWLNNGIDGVRADLSWCDLSHSDLSWCNLSGADLRGSDLSWCNLNYADLSDCDLSDCDLSGSNLSGADLTNITFNENTIRLTNLCPEGSFIAWKKLEGNVIAKLLIPGHAKRSNATASKCRTSEAQVLQILKKENDEWVEIEKGISRYDSKFVYEVGKTVKVDNFDENRWNECSAGIHFFIDRRNAENY